MTFPCPGIDNAEPCGHVSPPDHTGTKALCWRRAGHDGPHQGGPSGFEWPAGTRRVLGAVILKGMSAANALGMVRRWADWRGH